jgi:regulator of cell morphogenesis and NO signaling
MSSQNTLDDARALPYDEWELGFLADYIVNTHHRYIYKNLPDIKAYSQKVMQAHGQRHPGLLAIFQSIGRIDPKALQLALPPTI